MLNIIHIIMILYNEMPMVLVKLPLFLFGPGWCDVVLLAAAAVTNLHRNVRHEWKQGQRIRADQGSVLELPTNLREVLPCSEKTSTMAFPLLNAPISALNIRIC